MAPTAGDPESAVSTPMDQEQLLWNPDEPLPQRDELRRPAGARDCLVHRAGKDAYAFLHDPAIVAHRDLLLAAWYNCPSREIEDESLIRGRLSRDGGRTWGPVETLASDTEDRGLFYVPAVFCSHQETLYAFVTVMTGHDRPLYCEAFLVEMDQTSSHLHSTSLGSVIDCFLVNHPPERMDDGNFIMAGRMAQRPGEIPTIPAVALSQGADLTIPWRTVPLLPQGILPGGAPLPYPETTLLVQGHRVQALVRNDYGNALLFESPDCGRTWGPPLKHNLPIGASKLFAGTLSTGHLYLIFNRPTPGYRDLLVLAIALPQESQFRKMWCIRDGPSASLAAAPEWSYPAATELEGELHIAYTSEKRHCALTTIPLEPITL